MSAEKVLNQSRIAFLVVGGGSLLLVGGDLVSGDLSWATVINGILVGAAGVALSSVNLFIRQSRLIERLLQNNESLLRDNRLLLDRLHD